MSKKTIKVTLESLDKKIDAGFAKMATKEGIDELAGMINRGFEDVEERLANRIESIKTSLEARINAVKEGLDSRIDSVNNRLDALLDDMHQLREDIKQAVTKKELRKLEQRVFALEQKVGLA